MKNCTNLQKTKHAKILNGADGHEGDLRSRPLRRFDSDQLHLFM